MKLASNSGAAHAAVAGFAQIKPEGGGQQANLGSSNISSMQDGAVVANKILHHIAELVSGVKTQAGQVSALATEIEQRDAQDAGGWCEAK